MNRLSSHLILLLFMGLMLTAFGQSTGNKLYKAGQYDQAVENWDSVLKQHPELKGLHYNIGNAKYRQKKYTDAINQYEQSLSAAAREKRADAYYNLGNSYLAANQPDKAKDMYKQTLRLRPEDPDAKANLEMLLRMPPPPPRKSPSGQNQDKKQSKQQPEKQKKSETTKDQKKDQQQQPAQAKKDQQQQTHQNNSEQNKPADQQQQAARQQSAKQQALSDDQKKAAEQLLNALKDREVDNMQEMIRTQTKGPKLEKDW